MPRVSKAKSTAPKRKRVAVTKTTTKYTRTRRAGHPRPRKDTMAPKTVGFAIQTRKFTKLIYSGSASLSTTGAQYSYTHIWRANSIFDPDVLNLSKNTSCNGYGMASIIYQQYRVHGVHVSYQVYNTSAYLVNIVIGGANENNFPTTTYSSNLAARNGAKSMTLSPAGSDKCSGTISKYFKCCDLMEQTKDEYKTSDTSTSVITTNPVDTAYLFIGMGLLPEVPNVAGVWYRINLTYFVELYDIYDTVAIS